MLNLLRPDLIIDPETFKGMAEPNQFITQAISKCRSKENNWINNVKECLQNCMNTQWGDKILKNSNSYFSIIKLLTKSIITDEDRLDIIKNLEDLYTFSSLINRTKGKTYKKIIFALEGLKQSK